MMNKRYTSLILLSIVAPISLLTAFRLSGVLQGGSITFDTITAETVAYEMPRPSHYLNINRTLINDFDDMVSEFSLRVKLHEYFENLASFDGCDVIAFRITLVASVSTGFIYSFAIRFSYTNNSLLHIFYSQVNRYNLEAVNVREMGDAYSYVDTMGIDKPKNCSLDFPVWWGMMDEPHQAQNMTISAEVVHFNGTAYREFVIPIFLEVS